MRQSKLQLQNQATLMSCQIRAVERIKCAAGLAGAHQRWGDIDFLTPDPYQKKILHIHKQSLSENFLNLVSDIHPYPIATLAKYAANRQWLQVHQWTFIFENLFIRRL